MKKPSEMKIIDIAETIAWCISRRQTNGGEMLDSDEIQKIIVSVLTNQLK